jgi:stage V sporulation protein D (sporulation-specific penicillin-binding protein)
MKVSKATMRKRLFVSLVIGTLLFLALITRLGYVQIWKGAELSEQAEDSWRREIPFTAKRGEIQDRHGIK